MMKQFFFFFLFILITLANTNAQKCDTSLTKQFKNTVKWNLTPSLIIGPKSIVLGYERVVNDHQSFSINVGYLEKKDAKNKNGEPLNLFDQTDKGGFAIAADYRFFFKKRNIKPAPDGLYWGPYAGFYQLNFKGKSLIKDENDIETTIALNSKFQLLSAGVQLGYQFILFNDRFAIDLLLMGPSITRYTFDLGLE
jgi:hypothetical protein